MSSCVSARSSSSRRQRRRLAVTGRRCRAGQNPNRCAYRRIMKIWKWMTEVIRAEPCAPDTLRSAVDLIGTEDLPPDTQPDSAPPVDSDSELGKEYGV